MIKHIVLWKFTKNALGNSDLKNYELIKKGLEGLVGVVPGLVYANVGFHVTDGGFSACLESVFESRETLAGYQTHPAHLEVKKLVHQIICDRAFIDYEM